MQFTVIRIISFFIFLRFFLLLVAHETGVAGVIFGVALFTLPHLHGVLAVARESVFAVDGRRAHAGQITMTGRTFEQRDRKSVV